MQSPEERPEVFMTVLKKSLSILSVTSGEVGRLPMWRRRAFFCCSSSCFCRFACASACCCCASMAICVGCIGVGPPPALMAGTPMLASPAAATAAMPAVTVGGVGRSSW